MNPVFIFILSWLVPGLGFYVQGKRVKGMVFFFGVLALVVLGLIMAGGVTDLYDGKPLTFLGFLGSIGSGVFYFVMKLFKVGPGDITAYTWIYGTTYIAVAGFLNLLIAVRAYGLAKVSKNV